MKRVRKILVIFAGLLVCAHASPQDRRLLFTGEVYSRQAQNIIVPLTNDLKGHIDNLVPEGRMVEPGQVVVELDGSNAVRELAKQQEYARSEMARARRDLARLEKQLSEAYYVMERARVEFQLASMQATTPKELIGALEFAEHQLAKERASSALERAEKQFDDLKKSLSEREQQAELDRQKLELTRDWWQEMLESFGVKASQSGFVIHGHHPWTRAKFQQGDAVETGFKLAEVADTSDLAVRIWINGVDVPHVQIGLPVTITFDALPGTALAGRLESIAAGGSKRLEWGDGVYFAGTVSLDNPAGATHLLLGMSALVRPR